MSDDLPGMWEEADLSGGETDREVREPSPDDDVIVVDRDGVEWVRHYSDGPVTWEAVDWAPIPGRVLTWADLCAKRDARVYVPVSRLAAAEARAEKVEAALREIQVLHGPIYDDPGWCATCSTAWPCASRVEAEAALAGTAPEETSTDE